MIKFFRRIRRQLLTENKFIKYLIYAIGEIILVVIGILIALATNNYNEQKKAEIQSSIRLNDILEDLISDTTYLGQMIPILEEQLIYEEWLLNKNTFDINDIDSIKLAVNNIRWTFDMNNRSFINMQSSGTNKLIGFEQLNSSISKYYTITQNKIQFNNQKEFQKGNRQSAFEEVINQNIFISTSQYNDYTGFKIGLNLNTPSLIKDFEKIKVSLTKVETKNTLYEKYARHNYQYLTLYFCDLEAKKLIRLINESLNKYNKT